MEPQRPPSPHGTLNRMTDPLNIDELRREALALDLADRARLARDLPHSLDGLSEAEIEQLWLDEAELERRLADFERDPAAGEPWEIVRERIARRLAQA